MIEQDEEEHLILVATARDKIPNETAQAVRRAMADHCGNKPRLTRLGNTAVEFSAFRNVSGVQNLLEKQLGHF